MSLCVCVLASEREISLAPSPVYAESKKGPGTRLSERERER